MTRSHKDLFRIPTIGENIALFRSLLDSHQINPGEALALSGSIHAELRQGKGQDGPAYARYAQTMALLNHYLPDVHQHVVANWQLPGMKPTVSTSTSASTRHYSDSLFDDTIAMQTPGVKHDFESNKGQVKDEGEMMEVAGGEGESGEAGEGGGEDEESEEEDEPAEAEEPGNEKDDEELEAEEEIEEKGESESDKVEDSEDDIEDEGEDGSENEEEWEMGENEVEENGAEEETEYEENVEEPETEELVYEDIPEGESYDESEMGTEDSEAMAREAAEAAEHMNEPEYEIEPMEEEDPPWVED